MIGNPRGRLEDQVALLGTPRASEWKGSGPAGSKSHQHMLDRDYLTAQVVEIAENQLMPSPSAADGNGGGRHSSAGHQRTLPGETRLLPTPVVTDHNGSGAPEGQDYRGLSLTDATVRRAMDWGQYAPAIERWEALTRPAPDPTELNSKGKPRLAAEFSEWMMGLPAGHVTEVPGVARNEALKMCGNGVCPQQATAALRILGLG